jgi:hypothetical protein
MMTGYRGVCLFVGVLLLSTSCGESLASGEEELTLNLGVRPVDLKEQRALTPDDRSQGSDRAANASEDETPLGSVHRVVSYGIDSNSTWLESHFRFRALAGGYAVASLKQDWSLKQGYTVLGKASDYEFNASTSNSLTFTVAPRPISKITIHGNSCGLNADGSSTATVQHNLISTTIPLGTFFNRETREVQSAPCACADPAQSREANSAGHASLQLPPRCPGPGGGGSSVSWLCLYTDWYDSEGNYLGTDRIACWPVTN